MTAPVVDLARVRAALLRLDVQVKEHPELTGDASRERCAAWLAGEEPDEHAVDRASSAGRRKERPANRGD